MSNYAAGNDTLIGLAGGDTYVWNPGDGNDVIDDQGSVTSYRRQTAFGQYDRLSLGVNPDQVTARFITPGDTVDVELTITVGGATSIILIKNQATEKYLGSNGIERVLFADGTIWTAADLALAAQGGFSGYGSTPTIVGDAAGGRVFDTSGNDVTLSRSGSNLIVTVNGFEHITVASQFGGTDGKGLEEIDFDNGTEASSPRYKN